MRSSWKPSGRSGPTARCTLTFAGARATTASAARRASRRHRVGRGEPGEVGHRQLLAPGRSGRCRRRAAAPRPPPGCPPSGRARRAAPCGGWRRRRRSTAKVAAAVARRRRPADQGDQPRVDVRLRPEDPPADRAGPADLAVPGGLHRGDAVGAAARAARPAARPPPPAPGPARGPASGSSSSRCQQHRDGDVVRQVGDQRGRRRPGQLGDAQRVGLDDREPVGQVRGAGGHGRAAAGRPAADRSRRRPRARPPAAARGSASRGPGRPRGRRRRAAGPAVRTIRRIVLASCRKFCPSVFVGRRSSCWASSRIAAGPSSPSGCSGRAQGRPSSARTRPGAAVRPLAGAGALSSARAVCCSRLGCVRQSPAPPTRCHVPAENWYSPP